MIVSSLSSVLFPPSSPSINERVGSSLSKSTTGRRRSFSLESEDGSVVVTVVDDESPPSKSNLLLDLLILLVLNSGVMFVECFGVNGETFDKGFRGGRLELPLPRPLETFLPLMICLLFFPRRKKKFLKAVLIFSNVYFYIILIKFFHCPCRLRA